MTDQELANQADTLADDAAWANNIPMAQWWRERAGALESGSRLPETLLRFRMEVRAAVDPVYAKELADRWALKYNVTT